MITPSALVPVLDKSLEAWFTEPGGEQHLIGGLRIVVHEGGRIERAAERFASSAVQALPLPERLGGGFVFYQADSQGTRLWRSTEWTGPLSPLTFIGPTASEVRPGFDRLYLRLRSNGQVMAIDAETGAIAPLGPLPASSGHGAMVFADSWRGVVETDIRGPLATFDGGASWFSLPIDQAVLNATVIDGDPVLYVGEGWYRIDPQGQIQFLRYEEEVEATETAESVATKPKPLGDDPIRMAIAHGHPLDEKTAIVAYRGGLSRVRLPEGVIEAHRPRVLDDDAANCTGAQVGEGIGFICGVDDGPTTIYRYENPLALALVARFEGPRFVSPAGNGALVVRGKCDDTVANDGETRPYCILDAAGGRREIAVRGELGAERVVALADGRTVVLVPPRLGRPGRVTVIAGDKLKSHDLVHPDEASRAAKVAQRGLWLDGFQERAKGTIGGWVEAGGPVMGVRVDVDSGKVELGDLRDDIDHALVSGPLGLIVTPHETALESLDGGLTWREMELPVMPSDDRESRLRGCTAVGCVMRGWLRVGWGEPGVERDLEVAATPETAMVKAELHEPLRFRCELLSSPAEAKAPTGVGDRAPFSGWHAFHGVAPPPIGKDELGVDKASQYTDETPAHVYVWGPKGADWTKTGLWQIRFDDRFRVDGVSSSAPTRALWSDEITASEAIGARHQSGYWRWDAAMDPSGKAAIANLCMGTRCLPYAVAEGEPIVQYKATTADPSYRRPLPHGVARVGESWYFLTEEPGGERVILWRGRLGVMEPAAQLGRLDRRRYPVSSTPRLVRRALGSGLGILIGAPPDPASGSSVGRWLVLPIDPDRASLGEPIDLGPTHLDSEVPRRCASDDDGWLVETSLPSVPVFQLVGTAGYVDDVELRMRIDPASICVEAIAARAGRTLEGSSERGSRGAVTGIPMAVRERYSGRRWSFSCGPR
jgi:hypothetical protein